MKEKMKWSKGERERRGNRWREERSDEKNTASVFTTHTKKCRHIHTLISISISTQTVASHQQMSD